jgi:hypothetical protein
VDAYDDSSEPEAFGDPSGPGERLPEIQWQAKTSEDLCIGGDDPSQTAYITSTASLAQPIEDVPCRRGKTPRGRVPSGDEARAIHAEFTKNIVHRSLSLKDFDAIVEINAKLGVTGNLVAAISSTDTYNRKLEATTGIASSLRENKIPTAVLSRPDKVCYGKRALAENLTSPLSSQMLCSPTYVEVSPSVTSPAPVVPQPVQSQDLPRESSSELRARSSMDATHWLKALEAEDSFSKYAYQKARMGHLEDLAAITRRNALNNTVRELTGRSRQAEQNDSLYELLSFKNESIWVINAKERAALLEEDSKENASKETKVKPVAAEKGDDPPQTSKAVSTEACLARSRSQQLSLEGVLPDDLLSEAESYANELEKSQQESQPSSKFDVGSPSGTLLHRSSTRSLRSGENSTRKRPREEPME